MGSGRQQTLRKYYVPELVFGEGALELAGRHAANLGAMRVLLVTDPGVVEAGWADRVTDSLLAEGLSVVRFAGVTSNPKVDEVEQGVRLYARSGCNAIVATGGGSPIDCAKGIGIRAANDRDVRQFSGVDEIPSAGPPLICVPTTAGSGADVSQFAVLLDREARCKFAVISKKVVPDVSLIDPDTTATVDPDLAVCTGLDVLSHAFEALASNARSPMTDVHAREALRLLVRWLPGVRDRSDAAMRRGMMLASTEAAIAFSNASLGAVHALSHALGGRFELAHGLCNAVLLPTVVEYNWSADPAAYERIGEALGLDLAALPEAARRDRLVAWLRDLGRRLGVDGSLTSYGVTRADVPDLAAHALEDACLVTNPRRPTRADLETLYERAL